MTRSGSRSFLYFPMSLCDIIGLMLVTRLPGPVFPTAHDPELPVASPGLRSTWKNRCVSFLLTGLGVTCGQMQSWSKSSAICGGRLSWPFPAGWRELIPAELQRQHQKNPWGLGKNAKILGRKYPGKRRKYPEKGGNTRPRFWGYFGSLWIQN